MIQVVEKILRGAVAKSKYAKTILAIFPTKAGEVVKTGGRGRPVEKPIETFANEYQRKLPAKVDEIVTDNPSAMAVLIDLLADSRRAFTEEEAEYVANGRDAQAMGTLNGEPVNTDIFNRYNVCRREGESLGNAFLRQVEIVLGRAQEDANLYRKTLYVFVERYATERNLRDEVTAKKYGAPESAVGLMSRNIVAVVVTDNPKEFKGLLGRVAMVIPEKVTKKAKVVATTDASEASEPEAVLA